MAELESLHTRRPTQQESTIVSMTDIHSDPEYANPFQNPIQHQQEFQPQRHYNVAIPAIDHWPAIFARALGTSAKYIAQTARDIRDGARDGSAPSGKYQNVPTSANGSSSFQGNSFGGRRHSKNNGGATTCFSRRISRILFFLLIVTLVITWIAIPKTLKPFHDRDVWIRYFNHEEAIKISLPYSRVVHVQDVKKVALKELDTGYRMTHVAGNVRLLSHSGLLDAGEEWDNNSWRYMSWSSQPILMMSFGNELFQFLNDTLGCFSGAEAYNYNLYDVRFKPENNDYQSLARILNGLGSDYQHRYMSNSDIMYLRRGFDDPLQNQQLLPHESWVPPKKPDRGGNPFMEPFYHITTVRPDVSWSDLPSPVPELR